MNTPMGSRDLNLKLTEDGSDLKGEMSGQQGTQPFTGTVNGDEASWTVEVSGPMGSMALAFAGKVDGDAMNGTVEFGGFGSGDFTGTRG
ncbi:MAG: hypothetical protein WD800_00545 [Dehalococcoidia bacterium]